MNMIFTWLHRLFEPSHVQPDCPDNHSEIVCEFTRNLEQRMSAKSEPARRRKAKPTTKNASWRSKHA